MKKVLAVICSAVLTIGMAVTAFAQPSVVASGVVTGISKVVDADGNTLDGGIGIKTIADAKNDMTEQQKKAADDIKTTAKLKEVLGNKYEEGMTVIDVKYLYQYGAFSGKFPMTITFDMTGVTSSSKVQVLAYNDATGQWEVVECTVGNGTVTAVLNSLSLVAFVVDGKTAATINTATGTSTGSGSSSAGSNTSTVSPKTGEGNTMMMVAMFAAIGLAGMAVVATGKKRA